MFRCSVLLAIALSASLLITSASAQISIRSIDIEGNRRVETPTILSYLDVKVGQVVTEDKVEEILKNLFATGLFADVVIEQQKDRLLIKVVENKIINRIAFEGNSKLKDEILQSEIGLKPREVYTPAKVQEAAQKIRDMYRLSGRYGAKVEPKIVEREQNRVDLIFEITEGNLTRINRIIFVGNNHFSSSRLSSVVLTRESRWYRFFSSDDTYDPDRLAYDKELLRRYYHEHGYADFKVDSVVAELDPDEQEFYITYTVDEGPRYCFGDINLKILLPKLKETGLRELISLQKGECFDSKEIERVVDRLNMAIGERGFAFVEIEPKLKRHPETLTIDVEFVVKEGRSVYINRIDIIGNDRTDDDVIRREIRLSEGDPYNSVKIKRSEQRIENLDFFKKVEIKREETAAPDKIDLKVEVEDKPTGSVQFSAGYSTTDGPLASVTMNERNLMGRGYDLYSTAMVSKRAMDFHTGVTDPYFLGKPLVSGIDLFHSSRKYPTRGQDQIGYRQIKTGGAYSLGYDLTEYLGQSWNYTLARDFIDDIRTRASPFLRAQRGTWFMSSVGHGLFYDKRDSSVDPTEGYFAGLTNELSGIGGNVRFFKNSVRAGVYLPLDEDHKWVIATKGSGGAMTGLGNRKTRVVDRFELGGDSFRGFVDSGIGPRDIHTGDALGGLLYYKGTVELAVPLGIPEELGIKGSIFSDLGSVWYSSNKSRPPNIIRSNDMRFRGTAGVAITWRSPFGPIGVSFAKPFVYVKHVDQKELFRLNFGTTF
ncbi:MAG TPA: outer membrane protein assembly factor BamA [Alphaproteobacteria bacterium]|nr:outer membrane protein assembly factor BamA [Alphaproteobacteria bacterium]